MHYTLSFKYYCRLNRQFELVDFFDTLLVGDAARSEIKDFRTTLLTLAVARRKFPLGARILFDRGAIAVSFPPPRAAIDRKAPPIPLLCS